MKGQRKPALIALIKIMEINNNLSGKILMDVLSQSRAKTILIPCIFPIGYGEIF
jgi:hypothetical protein